MTTYTQKKNFFVANFINRHKQKSCQKFFFAINTAYTLIYILTFQKDTLMDLDQVLL